MKREAKAPKGVVDDNVRRMLEARRVALNRTIRDKAREARAAAESRGDSVDEDLAINNHGEPTDSILMQVTAHHLERVERALRRMDEGRYGLCAECGERIAEKRLAVLPFALRCRPCEEAHEERSSRPNVVRHVPLAEDGYASDR